jgi:hypothetical protein
MNVFATEESDRIKKDMYSNFVRMEEISIIHSRRPGNICPEESMSPLALS